MSEKMQRKLIHYNAGSMNAGTYFTRQFPVPPGTVVRWLSMMPAQLTYYLRLGAGNITATPISGNDIIFDFVSATYYYWNWQVFIPVESDFLTIQVQNGSVNVSSYCVVSLGYEYPLYYDDKVQYQNKKAS